jgi:hypothetical protein
MERDALQARVNIDAVPEDIKPPYFPPENFSLLNSAIMAWMVELPGLIFICVGLAMIFSVRQPQLNR